MTERLVLVVLDARLAVEIDVEELARVQSLRERMRVVQARHLLVARLRVQAHDVTVLQLRDEGQRMADRRQENVAARLIRLRLQANLEVVAARLNVGGDRVQALLVAVECRVQVLRRVVLRALASAPHDERRRPHLRSQIHVAQDLAQAETADRTVVVRQAAILEDRVREGIRRDHLDDEASRIGRLLHLHDAVVPLLI